MTKQQLNVRIPDPTRDQIDALCAKYKMTPGELVTLVVDRLYQKVRAKTRRTPPVPEGDPKMRITIFYSPEHLKKRQANVEKWLDKAKSTVIVAGYSFTQFKEGKDMSSRWSIVGGLTAEGHQRVVDALLLAFDLAKVVQLD